MAKETKAETTEVVKNDHIVLISPSGHKYEVSISDEGNVVAKYVPGDAE